MSSQCQWITVHRTASNQFNLCVDAFKKLARTIPMNIESIDLTIIVMRYENNLVKDYLTKTTPMYTMVLKIDFGREE